MLILTRRIGESLIIEPITVTVLGVKGNQVRVGTDAPADITILREELVSSGVQNVNTLEAAGLP